MSHVFEAAFNVVELQVSLGQTALISLFAFSNIYMMVYGIKYG